MTELKKLVTENTENAERNYKSEEKKCPTTFVVGSYLIRTEVIVCDQVVVDVIEDGCFDGGSGLGVT